MSLPLLVLSQPEEVIIEFERGIPVALNDQRMSLVALITMLNQIAGLHGVGRIDHIENRLIGIKSREVYEAPAAMTLIAAHKALEAITLVREVAHIKPMIEQRFASMIYEGLWSSPLRHALYAFIAATQQSVNGKVRVRLYKGHATVVGRSSPCSLYVKELATYAADDQFDHHAAVGFIKLWGLPTETHYKVSGKVGS